MAAAQGYPLSTALSGAYQTVKQGGMTKGIKCMVRMGSALGKIKLFLLAILFVVGCNKTSYEAVFSPDNMTTWFESNHSGLQEMLNIAKTQNNIRSMQLCGDGHEKSQIRAENGVFFLKNKISFPMTVERCITVRTSFDEDVGIESLVVTLWLIADGFCLPLKSCEVTRIKYFEEPSYYYESVFKNQSKVRLFKLSNSKWYLVKGDYYN